VSKSSSSPAVAPVYANKQGLADALGISVRQLADLRRNPWFPEAIELGPRTLRWDVNEVLLAVKRQAPRTRVGAEPAALVQSRQDRAQPAALVQSRQARGARQA
jgi:predicted DNA-binding transcriptional regulator AlpA